MNLPRKDYGCPLRVWQTTIGGVTRYTAMPPRSARAAGRWQCLTGEWWVLLFIVGSHTENGLENAGPHLGQRIHWRDLPPSVQAFLRQSVFGEYCPEEGAQ